MAVAHTGVGVPKILDHRCGTLVSTSALFSADFTSFTDKSRLYSCTNDNTMPIRLRMSISLEAFVLNLVFPERPSVIHRWTVDESVTS
ncbi:hypothetical protein M514_16372 [Trichuris suis]|uniref:Uncharacterized protein n=1 Tax=Trichuris suis TaxID=68888 RepID=A0A085MC09_9BILA|nr:hypothetical protein M513_07260 [Trichuris suis]KFD54755.1 hypothetical protein M513_04455 [Trichuris suis]KFD71440.1 hypothetical protein M514_16372 [Trichuris suis]